MNAKKHAEIHSRTFVLIRGFPMFPRYNQARSPRTFGIRPEGQVICPGSQAGAEMGLWGVLIDILKTAATHAAPHVARSAVDMARERMGANKADPQAANPVDQLNAVLSSFDQRIVAAEQRAAAAEAQLTALQEYFARKWASARVWVIALLCWNAVLTGLAIYLVLFRR